MSKREAAMQRRLHAIELMQQGVRPAEAAKQVGVARQTVYVWKGQAERGEFDRLHVNARGPRARLEESRLDEVLALLVQGAQAHGFADQRWTLRRIGVLIERECAVHYSETHIWRLLGVRGIRLSRDGVLHFPEAAASA